MAGPCLMVAIGGRGLTRDAFLRDALRRGAAEALWIDPSLGWAERYRSPLRDGGGGVGASAELFAEREMVWPGESSC